METRWLYTNSQDFDTLREASANTCVIPMGCVEKHSIYLPLGTDIIATSHIAYEASKLETFSVFPDYIFGDYPDGSPNAPKGSVTVTPRLQIELLDELCTQIARNGYNKIIIYNGHGGNSGLLSVFGRNYLNQKRDYVFATMHDATDVPHGMAEYILENGEDSVPEMTKEDIELVMKYHKEDMLVGHACMSEAAYIMDVSPENVHLDRLGKENGLSRHKTDYLAKAGLYLPNAWDINYPDAFTGHDPVGLNERISRAAVRLEAERLAKAVKLFKEDENVLRWHEERQRGW